MINFKKLGNNLLKGFIKEIPVVGGTIHNAVEETEDSKKGVISWEQFAGQIAFYILVGYLSYLAMKNPEMNELVKMVIRNLA